MTAHAASRRRRYADRPHDVATRPQPPATKSYELHPYRVICMVDKYDKDMGRVDVTVRAALGRHDAMNQAREQLHAQYPDNCPLIAERIEQDAAPGSEQASSTGTVPVTPAPEADSTQPSGPDPDPFYPTGIDW